MLLEEVDVRELIELFAVIGFGGVGRRGSGAVFWVVELG